jgi:VIT1/CCC1 family predicted Fe2+/Mn2+ transporter
VLGATSGALSAAVTAGLSFGVGALLPMAAMYLLPLGERMLITFVIVLVALGLTGWFAAWLTDLPAIRLMRRNVLLGAATMVIGVLVGRAVGL